MNWWEILITVIMAIITSLGGGAGIKAIKSTSKTRKEFVNSEKVNQEALHKIELKLAEISAKVDLVIKFSNKNKNTNSNTNEIRINAKNIKKGRKNCE